MGVPNGHEDFSAARRRAQAILRVRGLALAVGVLPLAVFGVLFAGGLTGHVGAAGSADAAVWDVTRWAVGGLAAAVLVAELVFVLLLRRATPPLTPAVAVPEEQAPGLYRLVREAAERMGVPAPGALSLTPDCDSWLEDAADAPSALRRSIPSAAPTLVIGSPFLWWMRADELRALLAPVVAGAACSLDPEIAAARRFVRSLDAALASRLARIPAGILLRRCRPHAGEMERAVAAWASERARELDYGLRIAAQEQVGLAYAGWDRLLTRVALPAWRQGLLPVRLNAGVVSALTELSRRDRLAEGFEARLERPPACDLLEEPGRMDEEVSLLAAQLFFPARAQGSDWSPVDWADYPEQVAGRLWRSQAAALEAELALPRPPQRALDEVLRLLRVGAATPPADQLAALICCAAREAGTASPGLDWLDGPVLLLDEDGRRAELAAPVALAVEHGEQEPLRLLLDQLGIAPQRPARLA